MPEDYGLYKNIGTCYIEGVSYDTAQIQEELGA